MYLAIKSLLGNLAEDGGLEGDCDLENVPKTQKKTKNYFFYVPY